MRTVTLPSGRSMPVLGMGTWQMGERSRNRDTEINALKHGMELGITLVDTAEMYGEGGAEEVISDAIAGRRDDLFLVSKVYPHNASRKGTIAACERSLRRLKTDYLDLYLLHWRGSVPLSKPWRHYRNSSKPEKFATMASAILTCPICRRADRCREAMPSQPIKSCIT